MMTDLERRITADSTALVPFDLGNRLNLPLDVCCEVFGSKFVAGDQPADGVLPLSVALLEEWEADVHITQYVSDPAVRCTKGHAAHYDLEFGFCMFDADFGGHKRLPDLNDFADLLLRLYILDVGGSMPLPNLVYATRGGARLVYLIVPCKDPEWFESHCDALRTKIDKAMTRTPCDYQIDMGVRDWGRLFRSARVTRDGDREYGRRIQLYHEGRLDLDGFKVRKKPERKPAMSGLSYIGCDHRLDRMLRNLVEGSRNTALFSTFCYIFRMYAEDQREQPVELARKRASESGLDDREIDATYRSAMNTTNNEQGKK